MLKQTNPEDKFPDFREVFPDYSYLDQQGAEALGRAIVLTAAKDYYDVCDHKLMDYSLPMNVPLNKLNIPLPALCSRLMLEVFLNSDLYQMITDIPAETFRRKIRWFKHANKPLPQLTNLPPLSGEIKMKVVHANSKHTSHHMPVY